MNPKEEEILNVIINYFKENNTMPTRRYLQKRFGYKSINSITQYLLSLEKQSYLKRNSESKLVLNNHMMPYQDNLKIIKIINTNRFIKLFLNKRKKYMAYKINNNYFNNIGIIKNDLLIIEITDKIKPNNLGLFIIDGKYRIMQYNYRDGFYLLMDNEELILNKIKIVGKVIQIIRKL